MFTIKIVKYFVLLLAYLFMSGCVSSPPLGSNPEMASPALVKIPASDYLSAIERTIVTPLPNGLDNAPRNRMYEITEDDAEFDFENFKSHYKIFSFDVEKDDIFRVNLFSFCKCLGFNKKILVPISHIVNSKGESVSYKITDRFVDVGFITYNLIGQASASERYYFFIAADNDVSKNKIAASSSVTAPVVLPAAVIPIPLNISSKKSAVGKIAVGYELNEEELLKPELSE